MMNATIDVEVRKLPRQERAKATVEAILEAAARILAEDGYARASTNRIAALAGVSVGTLYQYFPNKDAVVLAVSQEHSQAMVRLLQEAYASSQGGPIEPAVRRFVAGMIAAHTVDPALHRALTQQLLSIGIEVLQDSQRALRAMVEAWLTQRKEELPLKDLRVAAFVLVAAVESVVHAALFEEPELLAQPEFAEELGDLVLRYLGLAQHPADAQALWQRGALPL